MPRAIRAYVKYVDAINRIVGRFSMYLIFVMLGILFWSSVSKQLHIPSLWTLEMAQFVMVAYYMLAGGYSMQLKAHVRMDLLYSRWSETTRARVDSVTDFFLIAYLFALLYGAVSSTAYALKYSERSYSSWAPYMAPIKIIMIIGIVLMILQAFAVFFKDVARARGEQLGEDHEAEDLT